MLSVMTTNLTLLTGLVGYVLAIGCYRSRSARRLVEDVRAVRHAGELRRYDRGSRPFRVALGANVCISLAACVGVVVVIVLVARAYLAALAAVRSGADADLCITRYFVQLAESRCAWSLLGVASLGVLLIGDFVCEVVRELVRQLPPMTGSLGHPYLLPRSARHPEFAAERGPAG